MLHNMLGVARFGGFAILSRTLKATLAAAGGCNYDEEGVSSVVFLRAFGDKLAIRR